MPDTRPGSVFDEQGILISVVPTIYKNITTFGCSIYENGVPTISVTGKTRKEAEEKAFIKACGILQEKIKLAYFT